MSDDREQGVYSAGFYASEDRDASHSAAAVVPWLTALLRPSSVVDVGCGTGAWLAAFAQAGVTDTFGIDGPWLEEAQRLVPPERFLVRDLTVPLDLDRTFDLAICLEVAEHIPAAKCETLVDTLVALGDVVLFSAAIPGQGGLHHFNEQWPDYWEARFRQRGYEALDVLRPKLWEDDRVAAYYAQNAFLVVRSTRADLIDRIGAQASSVLPATNTIRPVVHPNIWRDRITRAPADQFSTAELVRAAGERALAASRVRARTLSNRLRARRAGK